MTRDESAIRFAVDTLNYALRENRIAVHHRRDAEFHAGNARREAAHFVLLMDKLSPTERVEVISRADSA